MSVKTQQVVNGELVDVEEVDVEDAVEETTEAEEAESEESGDQEEAGEEVEGEEADANDEETELYLAVEEDEVEASDSVPVAKHIDLKRKLKGTIKEQNEEMEQLKRENAQLKQQKVVDVPKPVRPNPDSFGTTAEFNGALDTYEQELIQFNATVIQQTATHKAKVEALQKKVEASVDAHYTRAEELVKKAKIEPEVFQQADVKVKQALEELVPGKGEATFNHLISMVGEGSEKVALYLGRNKKALQGFTDSLKEDSSGLNAMFYIGKLSEKLNGNVSKTSRAPKPVKRLKAGEQTVRASTSLKKYNEAHRKGNGSQAYQLKKEARAAGVDVSNW